MGARRFFRDLLACSLSFFFCILSVPASSEELTAEEQHYLHEKNTIVFVSRTAYPPFEFLDIEGEHIGMSVELARWISTEFGFIARFADTSFKDGRAQVLNGEADVLTSFFYSPERDRSYDFTQPVFNASASLFVASDRSDIKSIDDLGGKTIAMQEGDYAKELLESRNITAGIVPVKNFLEAAELLASRQADALIGDEKIVLASVHSNDLASRIKKVGEPLYAGQICMAVSEGNRLLSGILRKGIIKAREEGVLELINRKWLGATCVVCEIPKTFWERYKTAIAIVLVSLSSLTLLGWVWNTRLRSEVQSRTRALSESEKTLRTTLEALPVGVVLLRGQKISWVNKSIETMLGYTAQELVGGSVREFYQDLETFFRIEKQIEQMMEKNSHSPVECVWRRKDGSTFDCSFRYAQIEGKKDEPREIIIAEDISEFTAQRAQIESTSQILKSSERRFRHLFESLIDVYFSLDAQGILTLVSPSVERVLGFTPDEIIGKPSVNYYANSRDSQVLLEKIIKDGSVTNYEVLLKAKSGSTLWGSVNARLLQDDVGEYSGVEGQIRDVTRKKRADQLLRTQRDIATALSDSVSLETALNLCLQAVMTIQGVGGAGVYMVDAVSGTLHLVAQLGMPEGFTPETSWLEFGESQAFIIAKGQPFYSFLPDRVAEQEPAGNQPDPHGTTGWRAFACFPICHEGTTLGCINVVSGSQDTFDEFTRFSLEAIAMQIAGAAIRIRAEKALQTSRHNLKTLFDSLDEFLFILDESGKILTTNLSVLSRLGYPAAELEGKSVVQVHPQEHRVEAEKIMTDMLEGTASFCTVPLITRDGREIPVETRINRGTWNNKPAIFGISRDISDRLAAEQAKKLSDERLAAAIDAIDEGFVIYDASDKLLLCNAKYREMYEKTKDFIKPTVSFEDILREGALRGQYAGVDMNNADEWVEQRLKSHRKGEYNAEIKLADGRWMKVSERRMKDGSTVGFRVDISDVKKATEIAEKTLREKEVLLKEIHHRVKNNMQVVSSLLSLQAAQIDDPAVEAIFAEAQGRVMSMSLVHEILYRSDDLTMINLLDYLERLIEQVTDLFAARHGNQIEIRLEGENAVMSVDQAAPCGLIVVELLTNAYKYAFPEGRRGLISVRVRVADPDKIELSVADDGIGLPLHFDPRGGNTLGLRMVIELIEEQLEGEWELSCQPGAQWKLRWPVAFGQGG